MFGLTDSQVNIIQTNSSTGSAEASENIKAPLSEGISHVVTGLPNDLG